MHSNSSFQRVYKRNETVETRDKKRSKRSKLSRISMRTTRNHKESSYAFNS